LSNWLQIINAGGATKLDEIEEEISEMVKESESARLNETRNHKQYNTTNNNNNNHLNIVNINVNNEAANLEDYFASLEDNNEDDDDGDDLNSSLMEREELQKKIRHLRYY
jgi:hypothetical protein